MPSAMCDTFRRAHVESGYVTRLFASSPFHGAPAGSSLYNHVSCYIIQFQTTAAANLHVQAYYIRAMRRHTATRLTRPGRRAYPSSTAPGKCSRSARPWTSRSCGGGPLPLSSRCGDALSDTLGGAFMSYPPPPASKGHPQKPSARTAASRVATRWTTDLVSTGPPTGPTADGKSRSSLCAAGRD